MHPEVIYRLDRGLGPLLCAGLTLWRRVVDGLRRAPLGPVRKLVFLKMIEQGATVLAYPALREAVRRLGRENVYFWVFQENREIVDLLDILPRENVIAIRAKKPGTFLADIFTSIRRLRSAGVDAVVDMEFFSRSSAIFAFLCGARTRVGLHRFNSELPYRGDLFTHRVQYNPHLHTVRLYALLVEAAFARPDDPPMLKTVPPPEEQPMPEFKADGEATARMLDLIRRETGCERGAPFILLNPNASDLVPLRRWAPERMIELGQKILSEIPDAMIGITGAPSEARQAKAIARAIGPRERVLSLAGKTSLRELFVLYSVADVLITNDSGPGHFSSMTGIDAIVLFGPETPRLWRPLGPRMHILWAGLACSPCVSPFNHRFSPCRDNRCMREITMPQVWEELARVLAQREGRGR